MQYTDGTVEVTNGSNVVTGTGTQWATEIATGHLFTVVGDGVTYQISAVNSNTELELSDNYFGTTESFALYVISRDFTPNKSYPLINRGDIETAALYNRLVEMLDDE